MRLFNLGLVDWLDSQLLYHAQPRAGVECLNVLAPREPYVCIGYHQDLEQEVDLAACRELRIPVFRREVGGGAVYLDGRQIFFQLVLHRDNPLAAGDKPQFYRRLLQPVVDTYTDLGVPSRFKPVNDIVTEAGRKISGTGVAEIGDYLVLVGNLIADFDYETMTRILRVPDEKFRDKIYRTMRENLTTLERETGHQFTIEELAGPLIRRFAEVLGPLEPTELGEEILRWKRQLEPRLLSDPWLYASPRRRGEQRTVRISGEVSVSQRVHKAPGGLIRALVETREGRFEHVALSGDFFCYPAEAISELEQRLRGALAGDVPAVVEEFYATAISGRRVETPGVDVGDWLTVLGLPGEDRPVR